jgi:hypothetical protein
MLRITTLSSLVAGIAIVGLGGLAQAQSVSPTFECQTTENGTTTSYWGYNNGNVSDVTVPIGSTNKFTPAPEDRGQPTEFFAETRERCAFSTQHSGGNLVWTLTNKTGTASSSGASCESSILAPETIKIGECDTGIPDMMLTGFDACSISEAVNGSGSTTFDERITTCATETDSHGDYVSCIAGLAGDLAKSGIILNSEKSALVKCAAKSDIGKN